MIRIFIKNVLRSVAMTIIVAVVVPFLTIIVMGVWDSLLVPLLGFFMGNGVKVEKMNMIGLMIVSAVLGVVCSVIWLFLGTFSDYWFFKGKRDCVKHPPKAFFGVLWILIVPLVLCGVSCWMIVSGYDTMNMIWFGNSESDNNWVYEFLSLSLPAMAVSQICYAIAILSHYARWQICKKCKRMFCFTYSLLGEREDSITKYKTKTEEEKVGSIYADDQKLVDVKANVTREYATHYTITRKTYGGECVHCGAEKKNSSTS